MKINAPRPDVMRHLTELRRTLAGRSLLTVTCLTPAEFEGLIALALALKQAKREGRRGQLLANQSIAMLFEKSSTRTRCATLVAVADEGGITVDLPGRDIHLGKKESVEDTARVFGGMFDGIMFRGYSQSTVELLARASGIPVWNGLTDTTHPTQALADIMTIREIFGARRDLKVVYCGDGRNNVAISLMQACAVCGFHFVNCTPLELAPSSADIAAARAVAGTAGGTVSVIHDPAEAVRGANVIYTDVWVSMGEEAIFEERVRLLRPYQVNMALFERTGNLARGEAVFLHCLPAFHDTQTEYSAAIGALEVTDDVFRAPFSHVFAQAENRMHTIKALIVATVQSIREEAA